MSLNSYANFDRLYRRLNSSRLCRYTIYCFVYTHNTRYPIFFFLLSSSFLSSSRDFGPCDDTYTHNIQKDSKIKIKVKNFYHFNRKKIRIVLSPDIHMYTYKIAAGLYDVVI